MSDKYSKNADHISKLANLPPEELTNHLVDQNPGLNAVAPGLAPHLYGVAAKAIQYLHSNMPKPAIELPGQESYEPSKGQKDTWLEKHDTVNDPISVLDHVKNGTLTGNHMQALQAVHPDLLQNMQQEVASNAEPKAVKKLHYSTKIALSKFLGTPMNPNMLPGIVANDQAQFSAQTNPQQGAQPQKRGKGSTQSGLAKLSLGKRAQTETTRDESED